MKLVSIVRAVTASIAIFLGGLLLNTFNKTSKPNIVEFFYKLNNVYTPPDYYTIAGPILKIAYLNIKEKVINILNLSTLLNFVSNESESSNSDRVANLSINILRAGSFYIILEYIKAITYNTEYLAA